MTEIKLQNIITEYNLILPETAALNFICRDTKLQIKQVNKLKVLLHKVKFFKSYLSKDSEVIDEFINELFHFQCVLNAKIKCMEMWINLKSNKEKRHNTAWNNLIDAQSYVKYALKVPMKEYGINEFSKRLYDIEMTLFPRLQFVSSGLIIQGGVCSICNLKIELCNHIEDNIYRGIVCTKYSVDTVEVNHIALVERPEDKGCYLSELEHDGEMLDVFSYQRSKTKKKTNMPEALNTTAILLRELKLDIHD